MDLVRISNAQLSFGLTPLLDKADFKVSAGERVCIVGRNGAGKSTLLKVLSGIIQLDDGDINQLKNLRVARLEQDPPRNIEQSVFDYVAEALPDVAKLLRDYHHMSDIVGNDPSEANLTKLDRLQSELDIKDAWQFDSRVNTILTKLGLTPELQLAQLSGGWSRKAALARALVTLPDLLMLDEPTNHLDVASIEWLEDFLKEFEGAIVFISHDRAFIRSLATRIVDLDRGTLTSYPGNYAQYLEAKEDALKVEEQQNALFDKKLAQEETWIRQGIKARRTRNEGRVRALKSLRQERKSRVNRQGNVDFSVSNAQKSGKVVFEAHNLHYTITDEYGNPKTLVEDFSTLVVRGDKIGLVGPNGIGKTTLIKLLMGDNVPTTGKVKQGVNLEIAYFDQYRNTLDEEKSVQENVAEGKQDIVVDGSSRHVLGYLQDFLFSPARARTPVKALSGGEKNRLLLAKLFLKPSNLLVLDEPTNDLDVETLELLEDILANYAGSVLIVSHDREFINNTVTSVFAFTGQGGVTEVVGGYDDFQRWYAEKQQQKSQPVAAPTEQDAPVTEQIKPEVKRTKKLSYKDQRELDLLPETVEKLEASIASFQTQVNDPAFFKKTAEETQQVLNQLQELESKLDAAFSRWEELEALSQAE